MTYPITPNPGIHNDSYDRQNQFLLAQQQLEYWARQLPAAMMKLVVEAIIRALNGVLPAGWQDQLAALETALAPVATAVNDTVSLIETLFGGAVVEAQILLSAVESLFGNTNLGVDVQTIFNSLAQSGAVVRDFFDGTAQLIDGAVDRLDGTVIQAATSGISDAQRALHALEDAAANAFGGANTAMTEFGAAVNNHLQALLSAFTGGALAGGSTLSAQVAAAAASLQSTLQTNAQFLTGLFGPLAPFVTVTGSTVTVDVPGAVRALVATLVAAINANASGGAALATAIENLFGAVFPDLQSDIAAAQSAIGTVAGNINAVIDQANGVLVNVKQALYNAQLPGVANTITTLSHI